MNSRIHTLLIGMLAMVTGTPIPALALVATVESHHKFLLTLDLFPELCNTGSGGPWAHSLTSLGDPDGNGFPELAVGDPGDSDVGPNFGALHILHLAEVNLDTNGDGLYDGTEIDIA